MATVLVLEPSADLREMVAWSLGRLGHDVAIGPHEPNGLKAIILEPADPESLSAARALVAERPGVRVICTSIAPRHAIDGLEPAVYLVKPYSPSELEAVLGQLL